MRSPRTRLVQLIEFHGGDAPPATRDEQVVPLTGDRKRPVSARPDELIELGWRAVGEAVDVESGGAKAGGDDRAIALDGNQPPPAGSCVGHAVEWMRRVREIELVQRDAGVA